MEIKKMTSNKIRVGMLAAMTLLLAASAGAQIRSTTAPYPPVQDDTKKDAAAPGKTTQKPPAGRTRTKAAQTTKTNHRTVPAKTASSKKVPAAPPAGSPPASNAPPAKAKATSGPGRPVGTDGKVRECSASDPSPAGTVIDGYRKVMVPNPLMPRACQWKAVE
jgi:hypothetical protein